MPWQYSDAPSHIAPEVGPSLLSGDGPWSGVVLESGAVYVLSVEVNAPGETTVGWGVTATDGSGGEYVLADAADGETVPGGQWVTVTRSLPAPAFPTTADVTLAVPAGTEVRDPAMGVRTGRTVLTVPGDVLAENIMAAGGIVAGTPGGARVELTDQGLTAYDGAGAETAHIAGEGGEFVGGSFRTSDNLPGRVRIADDAFTYSGRTLPGVEIIPEDTQSTVRPAGIGPWGAGAALEGGEDTSGRSAKLHATPTQAGITSTGPTGDAHMYADSSGVSMRTTRASDGDSGHVSVDYTGANLTATDGESGEYGRILARPGELRMTLRDGSGNATGEVRVIAGTTSVSSTATDGRKSEVSTGASTGARLGHTDASGVYRRIEVTPSGFYLATNVTGSVVRTNLETLVSDVESLKARVSALEG